MFKVCGNESKSPFFSIVISTCNRPGLLQRCLERIANQHFDNYEVIIINNGSAIHFDAEYKQVERCFDTRFRFYNLNNELAAGFGPAHSRNLGIEAARGEYIAFCDDDDEWINDEYLSDVRNYLEENVADLVISNQFGISDDPHEENTPKVWFKSFENYLEQSSEKINRFSNLEYFSDIGSFPHLNISIYKTSFIKDLSGFNRSLWYEEDLDLFLRALQKQPIIAFNDSFVSNHYIPNKNKNNNITSGIDKLNKHKLRLAYLQNLISEFGLQESNNFVKSLASDTFKHLTMHTLSKKDYRTAKMYAFNAHCIKPKFKWFSFFIYIYILNLIKAKND